MVNNVNLKLYSKYDNFFDIQDSINTGLCYGYEDAYLRFYSRRDEYNLRYYIYDGHIEIEYTIFGALNYNGDEYWSDVKISELETKIKQEYINEYGGDLNYLVSYYSYDEEKDDYELNDKGLTNSGIATDLNMVINIIFDYMDECSKQYINQRIKEYCDLCREKENNTNE